MPTPVSGRWRVVWTTSNGTLCRSRAMSRREAKAEAALGNRTDPHMRHWIERIPSVYVPKHKIKSGGH